MSGRYERVNTHAEDDEPETPTAPAPRPTHPTPNSPPPSFRSRASSITPRERREGVDAALADAFDAEDDASDDDEPDDRQRLVRGNSFPTDNGSSAAASVHSGITRPVAPERQTTQLPQAGGSGTPFRVYGGGIQSDGVFSNLSAKPERNDGEKDEQPPTYEQAAADAAPPYWETTILAPGMGGSDEVYIDGMPVGSSFSFLWNAMISMSFQLVGFLLTYLLHSTHAAKSGSRAGLGITLIQYGFYMKGSGDTGAGGMDPNTGSGDGYTTPTDPNSHNFNPNDVASGGSGGGGMSDITSNDWIAYILMIVGWFILIRGVSDYLKAWRHEQLVLQSPDRGLGVPIIAEGERAETVV